MKIWIARDGSDNAIWCYDKKPIKSGCDFACANNSKIMFKLPKENFPEVTFENSPQQVELKLIKE